ncbi:MAG: N-acetylmuramoyl-L-alanine amidase-like domain-containing protein [Gemmatimonadales bacterium]
MLLSRRTLIRCLAATGTAAAFPALADARGLSDPDRERLLEWARTLRIEGFSLPGSAIGRAAAKVGELAAGSPYKPSTLEEYLQAGGNPAREPLTLSLTHFDCVTLVESCLAVARVAAASTRPTWEGFGVEVERMRYREGKRSGYASRLHYFSEWISDGERRGIVRDLGRELGGRADLRPLRFMTRQRESYPALADESIFRKIGAMERSLDGNARWVVPTALIPSVAHRIHTGDVLAFATRISGLDVTHAAFAYRDAVGILRVLHAPLSGGVVEITRATLPEYVAGISNSSGILVARPQD